MKDEGPVAIGLLESQQASDVEGAPDVIDQYGDPWVRLSPLQVVLRPCGQQHSLLPVPSSVQQRCPPSGACWVLWGHPACTPFVLPAPAAGMYQHE